MTESAPLPDETASAPSLEPLAEAIHAHDESVARQRLQELPPDESARLVSRLDEDDQVALLQLLDDREAADLVQEFPEAHAAQLLRELTADEAASILREVDSNQQADLIGRLKPEEAEAVLGALPSEAATAARQLMSYPAASAGGLMVTEYLAYDRDQTVDDVLSDLRTHAEQYRRYDVQYGYVTDDAGRLDGVLRMRDLLLAAPETALVALRIPNPLSVDVNAPLQELRQFFDRHHLFGVPVVDQQGRLCGVVRRQDVEEAAEERASRTFLKFTGILGGEELRSMPLRLRSARRLSWLSINVVLNLVAASVIAMYQDTLSAAITLAVFLPIISDMSGCSGNQAVAVSMRELALSFIRPNEVAHVLRKEVLVGIVNGLALGVLLGMIAAFWTGNPWLGGVVGAALAANTIIAVCLGGIVPLVLRWTGQDPALASAPILTTVTDMCGFFLLLSLASSVIDRLAA